jgi:hypothetical protein
LKKFVPYKSQLLSDIDYDFVANPKPAANRNENRELLFKEKVLRDSASFKTVNLSTTQQNTPLATSYSLEYSPTRLTFCFTSSNGAVENLSPKSRDLALMTNGMFMASLASSETSIINSFRAAQCVVDAFQATHDFVLSEEEQLKASESISLFGGVVCSISNLEETSGADWLLVAATVGTNKLFHFDTETKTLSEVSRTSDNSINRNSDPGNNNATTDTKDEFDLAAQSGVGVANPNLSNLSLYFQRCRESDVLILMSAVTYQNLDPIVLGKTPADCGVTDIKDWKDLSPHALHKLRVFLRSKLLMSMIGEARQHTPHQILKKLVTHCRNVAQRSKDGSEPISLSKESDSTPMTKGKIGFASAMCFSIASLETPSQEEQIAKKELHMSTVYRPMVRRRKAFTSAATFGKSDTK